SGKPSIIHLKVATNASTPGLTLNGIRAKSLDGQDGEIATMQAKMQRQARLAAALVLVAAWPPLSWAQSSKPQVGFLNHGSPSAFAPLVEAFRTALQDRGLRESQRVSIA